MHHSISSQDHTKLVTSLLHWFHKTKRDLPWRHTYNPYHVYLSEVMLQQTQMERGVTYFHRWIKRFPDVSAVAQASEQEILKYWEGLGYYARARNLHRAAKLICSEFGGEVPCDYHQLLTLPGVGPYTAAAIASIAGNYDVPVIDANVTRVYARLFNIDEPVKQPKVQKRLVVIAENLLPAGKARAYNQALMDLGGLVCTPKNPRCQNCPVASWCESLGEGTVAKRPVLGLKRKTITQHRVAGLIRHRGKIFIQQRRDGGVWAGLWEFPGGQIVDKEAPSDKVTERILEDTGLAVNLTQHITSVDHQYTHHKIILHCFLCDLLADQVEPVLQSASRYLWVEFEELSQFAFPAGPRKLLEYIKELRGAKIDSLLL